MTQVCFHLEGNVPSIKPPWQNLWFMRCDGCGDYGPKHHLRHPPLAEYRDMGWYCSPGCPVNDLCPKCNKEKQ